MIASCLTLLTDYGYEDGLVGVLHAVCFTIAPGIPVIDLDHLVPRQDVRLGALRLQRLLRYVPPGVHVAVVDPGVGSSRRAVALATAERVFVGPDNGLLLAAAREALETEGGGELRAVVLDREEYFLAPRSVTFDGRDVFAPVAARLASDTPLSEVGSPLDAALLVELRPPMLVVADDGSEATLEVIQIDGFGNVQLSGGRETLTALKMTRGDEATVCDLDSGAEVTAPVGSSFSDVRAGETVLLIDSDGHIALSVNRGRASDLLRAPLWGKVRLSSRRHQRPAPLLFQA